MSPDEIIASVARRFLLSLDEIKGRCRSPRHVRARIAAARLLRARGVVPKQIGYLLGGRTAWTARYYLDSDLRRRHSANGSARWARRAA